MLSERIHEFLLFGHISTSEGVQNGHDGSNSVAEIKSCVATFITEAKEATVHRQDLIDRMQSVRDVVAKYEKVYSEADVVQLLKEYKNVDNKVQLLVLASTLQKLNSYTSVNEVPDLVLSVLESLPTYIPNEAKIKIFMLETVTRLRHDLLESFHERFEAHLNESLANNDAKELWVTFLNDARDWLLAYAILSLLPSVVSDSRSFILDKYQEVLDEMLTPLWSRFHFHLAEAQEGTSFDQVIWTFGYAQSFVQMMVDLCSQITSSGKLQQIQPGDYAAAGVRHVTEKAVRFMRSHFAKVVVKHSPLVGGTCIHLVESAFEFDAFVDNICPQALTLSAVVYDSHTMFALWVEIEKTYFMSATSSALAKLDDVFKLKFGEHEGKGESGPNMGDTRASAYSGAPRGVTGPRYKCYSGVYSCLMLFITASRRYRFLPPPAQDVLAEVVLEPLLCVCVGVFVIRIRSHFTLYMISKSILPAPAARSLVLARSRGDKDKVAEEDPLEAFAASAQYFQKCLGAGAERTLCTQGGRYDKRWEKIQEWIPKDRPSIGSSRGGGGGGGDESSEAALRGLVGRAFACREAEDRRFRSGGPGGASGSGIGPQGSRREEDRLGAVVDTARAQAVTLTNVLERQLKKMAKSGS